MKMTLDLPDELFQAIEARALEEGLSFNEMVIELLYRGLSQH